MSNFVCSTVNDLFLRESGRFSVDVWERYSVSSPWGRLVRVGQFPQGMGTSIREETIERILSGSFEDDWSVVGTSSGGNAGVGCVPSPTDLQFGQTIRSWQLNTKSYRTPCICLDDLKTSVHIEQQVAKTVRQLTMLTRTVLDNRRRFAYASMVDKMSCGTGTVSTVYNAIDATLPAPTARLSQDLLDDVRQILIRNGAGENALGNEAGGPVLGLITSARTSRGLLRDNPDIRQDLRFANPSELVQPLGVTRSYCGFYHLDDPEIPRYDYIPDNPGGNPWVRRYPFVQSDTSNGKTWEPNPLYDAAAYELSFIFHPDVYEEAVQQVGPSIPDAPFLDYPHYYSGEFFWLNIISDENPLGKLGRWMSIFQSGNRPIAPYLGKAIMHLRCPNNLGQVDCSGTPVIYY